MCFAIFKMEKHIKEFCICLKFYIAMKFLVWNAWKCWKRPMVGHTRPIKNTSIWAGQSIQKCLRNVWRMASFWLNFNDFDWWKHCQWEWNCHPSLRQTAQEMDMHRKSIHTIIVVLYDTCYCMLCSEGDEFPSKRSL